MSSAVAASSSTDAPRRFGERDYQVRGITSIIKGLTGGGRGQLRSACGTGKTYMALRAVQGLTACGGTVVVAAPTVGLVAQILQDWRGVLGELNALAVCSDPSVQEDSARRTDDILERVTTDPDVVAAWLRQPHPEGIRVIVGTYASAHIIGEGLQKARQVAEVLVVDEAHNSAGRVDKHAALLHDDDVLPAVRRLYMTATPRIYLDTSRSHASRTTGAGGRDLPTLSMDDDAIFGPVLFNYPFSEAIADGWLDDYRLAVVGVTRAEVMELLHAAYPDGESDPYQSGLHRAMVQTAVIRAAAKFGLRRVIAFCPRIVDAAEFARTLPATLHQLPAHLQPGRPLHAEHVHGGMNVAERQSILAALSHPPEDGWTVVTNAKCLSEGIDVPTIDCVAFTAPKKSATDIVQAVGRALRRDPTGSGTATILVPILLPDAPAAVDEHLDAGVFETLWQVVRSLRAHDDTFSSNMVNCRASEYRDTAVLNRVDLTVPESYQTQDFLQHLTVRLVQSATSPWWDKYALLKNRYDEHGTTDLPQKYVHPSGVKLGIWIQNTRRMYKDARLAADRIEALEKIRFDFNPNETRWLAGLKACQEYHAEHGHLRVSRSYRAGDGVALKSWLSDKRLQYANGTLEPDRCYQLAAIDPNWMVNPDTWEINLRGFTEFRDIHGHLNIRQTDPAPHISRLGSALSSLRQQRRAGTLEQDKIDALDGLGIDWDPQATRWTAGLASARNYRERHGHLNPTEDYLDPTGFPLGQWLRRRRNDHAHGRLDAARRAALDALGMDWRPADESAWEDGLAAATEFRDVHGHLKVTKRNDVTTARGTSLFRWLDYHRAKQKTGTLADDKIAALDSLGIEWEANQAQWDRGLAAARTFHDEHGHLRVPHDYRTDDGFTLYSWILDCRAKRRSGKLSDERIAHLDALGINWEPRRAAWDAAFTAAAAFYHEHRHLRIPDDYRTGDGFNLYSWICKQRAMFAKDQLDADDAQKLTEIGMVWERMSTHNQQWNSNFKQAQAYYNTHHHLRVPHNHALYSWIDLQRRTHNQARLSLERAAMLEEIGMEWDPPPLTELRWDRCFEQAGQFADQHGHLRVPTDHPIVDGINLYNWIRHQRRQHELGELSAERVARLSKIGMSWEKIDLMWEKAIAEAAAYRDEHGSIDYIPHSYKTPSGFGLYDWAMRTRRAVATGNLPADRLQQLIDLGMRLTAGPR